MNTTIHTIEDLIRILDDHPDWTDALRARLLTRELIELPEKFTQFVAEMNRFVEATNRRFDALENRVTSIQEDVGTLKEDVGTLKIRVKSIQDDLGPLKGSHARDAAIREASLIAEDMGFQRTKTFTQDDLGALIARADTSGHSHKRIEKLPTCRPGYRGYGPERRNVLYRHRNLLHR